MANSIIAGNDFRLIIRAKKSTGAYLADMDLADVEDLRIYLTRAGRSKVLQSYTLDDEGHAVIYVSAGVVTNATYGIEMVGVYGGARLRAHNTSVFTISGHGGGNSGVLNDYYADIVFVINVAATDVYVQNAIEAHNENEASHPHLLQLIEEAGDVDDVQIDGESIVDGNKIAKIDSSQFGKVDDVKVNGTSVVSNKEANITIPEKVSDLPNDADYATKSELTTGLDAKQDTITAVAEPTIADDGGNPSASVDFEGGEMAFAFRNLKLRFSDLTPEERATLKGDKGDQGDSAVYDPSSPDAPDFVMANTTGQSTTKAMTQKAVTNAVTIGAKNDISALFTWTKRKFIYGQFSASFGNVGNSSSDDCYASDYVDISGYEKISITLPQYNNSDVPQGAAFYDSNKIAIQFEMCKANMAPVGMVAYTFDIPTGAKYIRATKRDDFGDFVCCGINSVIVPMSFENNIRPNYPQWQNGVRYAVGDKVEFDGVSLVCVAEHTSESMTSDWDKWMFIDNSGINTYYDKKGNLSYMCDGYKVLRIDAMVTSQAELNIGTVYYNTSQKRLRVKISDLPFPYAFREIPFYDGAIYTYNGELYVWNGSDLVSPVELTVRKTLSNGKISIIPIITEGYTISKQGVISYNNGYCYTSPIHLSAGETIVVVSSTGGYAAISYTDENATFYVPLVLSVNGGVNVVYEYTAEFDMYVALSYKVQGAETYIKVNDASTYYGGMYIFPFKTIANKDIWIYKDALFTGLKPLENYEVFVNNAESSYIKNQTRRALKFKASAGSYDVSLLARDVHNDVRFRKDIRVEVVNAPSEKLSSKSSFNVLFFGDSIIGQNSNKIGAEFQRYLSSDDAGGINDDGSIQPAAPNVCHSKMNLVGEMNLSNTRFQYLFQAKTAMTGKRDLDYGNPNANSISYFASHNPFYNPNSTEPDEIGEDGFNKRVDFGWYFENACGEGKYPDLIYMSIGANDIGTPDNYWSGNSVSVTVERVIAICKKMKAACDAIAGGTSEMKIKLFNHQSYPLDFASFNNLPIAQARLIQTMYYTQLYYKIISEGISDYVEFVDCASKFDIENGYDMGDVNSNARTTKANDYGLIDGDGVHMNQTGAFNYADCLINDFLADSDYD